MTPVPLWMLIIDQVRQLAELVAIVILVYEIRSHVRADSKLFARLTQTVETHAKLFARILPRLGIEEPAHMTPLPEEENSGPIRDNP